MQTIAFTDEELGVLREVLQHSANETDVEVFHTATREFKEMLKHRRQVLESILSKLPTAAVTA